jgi:hypothetical protein
MYSGAVPSVFHPEQRIVGRLVSNANSGKSDLRVTQAATVTPTFTTFAIHPDKLATQACMAPTT